MHGYHVGIALHHIHTILLGYGFLCLIQSVQFVVLVIYLALGRVDIFLRHALCGTVEFSAAKGAHLTAQSKPRKDDAPRIAVYDFSLIRSET